MEYIKQLCRYFTGVKEPDDRPETSKSSRCTVISAALLSVLMGVSVTTSVHALSFGDADVDGPNDPNGDGQNDLTRFTYDDDSDNDFVLVDFSFDEPSTIQGGNASNACIMFDTDTDGNVNNSFCVEVSFGDHDNDPATDDIFYITDSGDGGDSVKDFPAWIECADSKDDRCGQPDRLADPYNGDIGLSSCELAIDATDPFTPDGNDDPDDLNLSCKISKNLVGDGTFTNICSYPSAGNDGNNNPFDCLQTPGKGRVIFSKIAEPDTTEEFTFSVNGTDAIATIAGSGTSDSVEVDPGEVTVSEIDLPAGWSLTDITCDDGTTGPADGTSGATISDLKPGQTIGCTFTNAQAPTTALVTVTKRCQNSGGAHIACDTSFPITLSCGGANVSATIGSSDFTAEVETGSTCTVTEGATDGWTLASTPDDLSLIVADGNNSITVTNQVAFIPNPQIVITKTAIVDESDTVVDSAEDTINYTITAQNTGNIPLTGVTVTDPMCSTDITGPTGSNAETGMLPAGATWTWTCSYDVTQDDIDKGTALENTATVDTAETDPQTATAEVPVEQNPAMSVVKSVDKDTVDGPGELTYTITVSNDGNVTMSPSVSDLLGDTEITLPDPQESVVDNDKLDVGEQWTYTFTYEVTQDDIDNGTAITNKVCISDKPDDNDCSEVTTIIDQNPSHTLDKYFGDDSAPDEVKFGETGTFTLEYKNDGNVTNTDVTITDTVNSLLAVNSVISSAGLCADADSNAQTIECSVDSVAPGATVTVTVEYTAQFDADTYVDGSNQSSGATFVFYFANGYKLYGSTASGMYTLLDANDNPVAANVSGKNQDIWFHLPDGGTLDLHLSCSEPFIGGWPSGGQPHGVNDGWMIQSYDINRYNKRGFLKSCTQALAPLTIDNTAKANAEFLVDGTDQLGETTGSDSVQLIGDSSVQIDKGDKGKKGNKGHKTKSGKSYSYKTYGGRRAYGGVHHIRSNSYGYETYGRNYIRKKSTSYKRLRWK